MNYLQKFEFQLTPSFRASDFGDLLNLKLPLEIAIIIVNYIKPCDYCQEGEDPLSGIIQNGKCLECKHPIQDALCQQCKCIILWTEPLKLCYDCKVEIFTHKQYNYAELKKGTK